MSGEPEIGKLQSKSIIGYQDVLWLQVPVVNAYGMTVRYSIQELKESILDKRFLANVECLVGDPGEEVASRAELKDNVGTIRSVHDFEHGYHIGMIADLVMELDLALLEGPLPWFETNFVECLYGELEAVIMDMNAPVDDSICAYSENFNELDCSLENFANTRIRLESGA